MVKQSFSEIRGWHSVWAVEIINDNGEWQKVGEVELDTYPHSCSHATKVVYQKWLQGEYKEITDRSYTCTMIKSERFKYANV